MIRTQVQLTEEQSERLKEIAEQQGVSVAELIRRAVDTWLCDTGYVSLEQRRRRAIAAVSGFETGITDLARNHDAYFAEQRFTVLPAQER